MTDFRSLPGRLQAVSEPASAAPIRSTTPAATGAPSAPGNDALNSLAFEASMDRAFADMNGGALSAFDGHLAALYYEHSGLGAVMRGFISTTGQLSGALRTNAAGVLEVSLQAISNDGNGAALLADLQALGFHGAAFGGTVGGSLPVSQLGAMLRLDNLGHASQTMSVTNAGYVDTQADATMLADQARDSNFGIDGNGIAVGVISDSFNTANLPLTTQQMDQASNDLPAGANTVVLHDKPNGTDEGRAMAQIIHDIAPGAKIIFSDSGNSPAEMAQHILDLAAAGAKIIVDDISYFASPVYQDGVIAQAIAQVTAQGVTYFTSAANSARHGFEAVWQDSGKTRIVGAVTEHLAKLTDAAATNQYLPVTVDAGSTVSFILQWDQPAASATPGGAGSANDLDLFVFAANRTTLVGSETSNQTGADPVVVVQYTNSTGAAQTVNVSVGLKSGAAPGEFKLIMLGGVGTVGASSLNFNTGTMFGHNTSASAIAVGAVPYWATPYSTRVGFTTNVPPSLEEFSAAGPQAILFDTNGNRLATPRISPGPAFSAADGGETTFFGSDDGLDGSPYGNFYGTSAAAPGAAAIAALMLSANPSLTPIDIRNLMVTASWDIRGRLGPQPGNLDIASVLPNGYDSDSGQGFLVASAAVGFALSGTITPVPFQTLFLGTHLNDVFRFDIRAPGSVALGTDTHMRSTHRVDGGAGNDTLQLAGDYAGVPLVFGATTMVNVEGIRLGAGFDYTLTTNQATVAAGALLTIDGSALGAADVLNFNGAAETNGRFNLMGGSGNDFLRGGTQADIFSGGGGNDIYINPTGIDIIVEAAGAGGGTDTIQSGASYSMAAVANVERLQLTGTGNINGTGNALDNLITGNSGNNVIDGGDGADTLNGGAGTDTLRGGAGNDTYVNPTGDSIVEVAGAAGGTADTVQSIGSFSLATALNVERLMLTGTANANGIGNASNNVMVGNTAVNILIGADGNDSLSGGAGKDQLTGGIGNDTMNGGTEADTFRFATSNTGADTIIGFETALDRFDLAGGTFSNRTEGAAGTTLFHAGGTIVISGITGLSLNQWRALVLPAGGTAREEALPAAQDDGTSFSAGAHAAGSPIYTFDLSQILGHAPHDLMHLGRADFMLS